MAAAPVTMPIDPTNRELDYRTNNYKELKSVERKQIACATCGKNLSAKLEKPGGVFIHPFMSTLQCKKCHDFYGDSDFSMDEDGDDKYCRMCGNGGELFICGNKPCPYGFCQKCIDRHIGRNSSEVKADDWKCLHCNCKPMWEVRAVCAVLLEKTKKRIKHRKKTTRAEVYDSDDDHSRSQELDNVFENSRVKRRPLRSLQNSKKEDKTLRNSKENGDTSTDSHDNSLPVHKSQTGRTDSRTRSGIRESGAIHSSVDKRNSAGTSMRRKRLDNRIVSSEDETSDFNETQASRKKLNDSKTPNPFAEVKSKSVKQTNNQSSSQSLKRFRKTVTLSQKHPNGRSQSRESLRNPTSSSDPESSNESANDFVKSKKKKKFKTQEDKSSKNESAVPKKKPDGNESANSKVDPKHSNTQFGKVEKDNKIRESSLEPKRTNLNHFVKDFGTNTSRKTKVKLPSRMNTSESDAERDDSNGSTIPNKESTLHASREHRRSTGSVNQENAENEESESLKIHGEISKSLKVHKKLGQAIRIRRLSTRPLYPTSETSQASSSLDFHDKLLDRKKKMLRNSFAKFSDTRDCLTEEDATVIEDHVNHLYTEMEMFGKSICTGINVISQKHSMNEATSVQAISKTVLRCSLLMIRCKKSLNIIENRFVKSYQKWCQSSKVKSILPDEENSDVATGNQLEPIIAEETFVDSGNQNRIRQDSKKRKVADNSDASNEDENCDVSGSTLKKSNTLPETEGKSLENNEEWSDSKSPEEIDHNIREPVTRDSDGNSVNSRDDAISDCDREIFSENESGGQNDLAYESVTKEVLEKSPPLKASKKRLIESSSDEHETVETENLEQIKKKSLEFDNVIETPENVSGNHEEATECAAEKITEESSTAGSYIGDTDQPDSSLENIHEDTVAADLPNTLNLNEESKQSGDGDHSVLNDSESTENLSMGDKSTLPDTEITRNSINDIQMDDDDDTLELWDKSMASKQKSRHTSKRNNKQKISSSDANENEDELSDCDAMIFTQLPSDELATESNPNNIAKSNDLVESLGETEDTCMSDLQIESNTTVPSPSDDNCTNEAASSLKESSYPPKTIPRQHEEADDSDTSEKPASVSKGSKSSRKSQGSKNDSENDDFIPLLLEDDENDSKGTGGTGTVEEEESQESDNDSVKNHSILRLSENEEKSSTESADTGTVDKDETRESQKKLVTVTEDDSEEAIKRKILESDSDESDESTPGSNRSNSFQLKVNSDSEEYRKEIIAMDTSETMVTSKKSNIGIKSRDSNIEVKKLKHNPVSAAPEDDDISKLNNLAKHRLLASSDTSSSDDDDVSSKLPAANLDNFHLDSTSSRENDEIDSSSINEIDTTILSPSKSKGKKFSREENYDCKTDKKLQMNCKVVVRKLDEKVLDQFRRLLGKSRERQELEDFNSLVDLNNIKKRKRDGKESNQSESSSESSSSKGNLKKTRSKQVQEKEETLLDHLEKMINGENYCNPSGDETEENNDILKKNSTEETDQDEFLTEANKLAKDRLIESSDSENEMRTSTGNAEEQEQEEDEQEGEGEGEGDEEEEEEEEKEQKEEEEEEEQEEEEGEGGEEGEGEGEEQEQEQEQEQEDDEEEKEKEDEEEEEEAEEEEQELTLETQRDKQKGKDISDEEVVDSESNHENGSTTERDNEETTNVEENVEIKENEDTDSDRTRERDRLKDGLAKRNWRLTDSDSSDEEKKWNKSQLTKTDEKKTAKQEEGLKKKKTVKRRVLGSDSDSVKLTDVSDDESSEADDDKKNASSDTDDSAALFNSLRKKRTRKRNAQKSDSDSDSDQDEKPTKQKRKRIKKMESDSDSDPLTTSQDTPGKLHRKNIRKVLKDKQVADVTKIAGKEEEERLRRIADRQKLYNEMYELKLANEAKVEKLILDFDEETKKILVSVHEDLVKRLKPHQAQGIKFMWDACFESLERTKSTTGSGCIVAHCMGLGKTFQVVTLAHTLLTHAETGIKTIMVICPLSTVLNWVNEFKKWLGDINNDEDVEVFEMTKMKKNFERKYQLEKWHRAGGVMVLGYEMFRLLSNQTGKKMRKSLHDGILKCLVDPGPDLIVCDEGHLLKNEDTALSKAMRRVKTLRRIVLTGTPLQNNLVEYHCMVQFVKPNLLGTKKEFLNRFVNPITNGQFDDSTEYDVKLMKKRAHVLHKMLEGSVQRFDYSVLTPFLPPKQEYVITVRLADIQIKLYQFYLDNLSRKKVGAGTSLFADFQALQRIWTHPIVLRMNAEKVEKMNEKKRMDASDSEGSLRDFLDDGSDEKSTSSEDSDVQSAHSSSDEKTEKPDKPRRGTRANPVDLAMTSLEDEEVPQSGEWWSQFVEPEHFEDMRISSKLVLLFAILNESEQIGDKVLVFSQSLYALSLIEEFLNKIDDETQKGTCSELIDNHSGSWSLGLDYFRLDGQTPPENRSHYCKIFNNPKNSRARLFLISTRAGGLGINLTAANRVIIFDASWNPSHDVQSIFRIYRFGQKKPCYVYRFLAQGTMEEKIYNRQVTKLSLSCRVVDEQQIERHYSNHDLAELYQFEPNSSKDKPTLNLPKDRLLAEILRKYEDRIETFHEHDSLLENKAEEELDEEERKEAWKEYEDERTGRKVPMNNFANQNFNMQQYNDMMNMNSADIANRATLSGINIDTLQSLIKKDYPNSTPEQQKMMTQRAIMDMYTYMENEAIRQQQIAAAARTFTYPTVSNLGTGNFMDGNTVQTSAQRQYAMQQHHQIMAQREQQANYAKRFGNVRGPGLSATATRPPPIINLQDDNDIIEVPTTPPAIAGPTPSSSVQTPSAAPPVVAANSKRQEE